MRANVRKDARGNETDESGHPLVAASAEAALRAANGGLLESSPYARPFLRTRL